MSEQKPETKKPREKSEKLVKKHHDFVEHYLLHFNATQAYKATYGTKNDLAAGASASKLLKQNNVQQYLQQRLAERKAELHLDTNYVVRKYNEILAADYVDGTQYLTKEQLDSMPKAVRLLVQSVELMKTTNKTSNNSGDYTNTTIKYKVTFMSKDNALNQLGKHTGAFIKDNLTGNFNLDQMTFTDALKQLDI